MKKQSVETYTYKFFLNIYDTYIILNLQNSSYDKSFDSPSVLKRQSRQSTFSFDFTRITRS